MRAWAVMFWTVVVIGASAPTADARQVLTGWPSWGTPEGGPDRNPLRPSAPYQGASPGEVWRVSAPLGSSGRFVVVDDDRVFALGSSQVQALSVADGAVQWSNTSLGAATAGPAAGDGILVIPRAAGLVALSQATGAVLWTKPTGQEVVIGDDTVFATSTADGSTFDVDAYAIDGTPKYHRTINTGATTFYQPTLAPPVYVGGRLILQANAANLYALDGATGLQSWAFPGYGFDACYPHVPGTLLTAGGRVFLQDECAGIMAFDAATGAKLWEGGANNCKASLTADASHLFAFPFCSPYGPLTLAADTGHATAGVPELPPHSGPGGAFGGEVIYGPTVLVLYPFSPSTPNFSVVAYRDELEPSLNVDPLSSPSTDPRPTVSWTASDGGGSGVASFDVLVDGTVTTTSLPASQTSYRLPDPLADGPHTIGVRVHDAVGNISTQTQDVAIDTHAPSAPVLGAPADGTGNLDRDLTFTWSPADDGTGTGIAGYAVLLDGTVASERGVAACTPQCSGTIDGLGPGAHTWQVRATDAVGFAVLSATRTFTVAPLPTATLDGPAGPVLTGAGVTFAAARSHDAFAGPVSYAWDLDGDGTYEIPVGAAATQSRTFAKAGSHVVAVRVTDARGRTADASVVVDVRRAPPDGHVGVTIDGGARFTNDPQVELSVVWPSLAQHVSVSNDGGFANPLDGLVTPTIDWVLPTGGSELIPHTVYVRFDTNETYTDDIILDQTAPKVGVRVTHRGARRRTVAVTVTDAASGADSVQIAAAKSDTAAWRPAQRPVTVRTRRFVLYARGRDVAGNVSHWKRIRVRRTRG